MERQYAVSRSALYRHRCEHVAAKLAKARGIREVLESNDLLGQAQMLQEQAFRVLADASKPKDPEDPKSGPQDPALVLKAVAQVREGVRLLGEVLGLLKAPGSPTINVSTGTVVVLELPSNGREPGARAAAIAKLREMNVLAPRALALLTPGSTVTADQPSGNGASGNGAGGNGKAASA